MKLFLDTANLADIETALQKGFITGITTNPSLMAKEPKGNYIDHMKKIVKLIDQYSNPVSLSVEVFAQNKEDIITQAEELVGEIQYENLSIKVPIGWEELEAIYTLSNQGISVNCTCIFSEAQCMLATNAGAQYISIFGNRVKELRGNFTGTVGATRKWLDMNNITKTEIIMGSIRSGIDIVDAQLAGAHIVTAGLPHYIKMSEHPGTTASVDQFMTDFEGWLT
jgi:transaldolase|tara:strand:+ start:3207 stop:3878 length:672 start_codon:yes stop_codon:yes gene_type:complete